MITPKTNWTSNEQETPTDFNRQKDNIEEIATVDLPSLYYFPEHTSIADVDRTTLPTRGKVNTLEDNLAGIEACGVPLPAEWGAAKTWTTGGPIFSDFNRWERNAQLVSEMVNRVAARFPVSGSLASGGHLLPRRI